LRKAICAALLGCVMLVAAAPAANATDSWSEPTFDFGNQNVGSTSDPHKFALVATCDLPGAGNLCISPPGFVHNFGTITTTGAGFAIVPGDTDVCNARGGTLITPVFGSTDVCTLDVVFNPTSGGVRNGTLTTTTSPTGLPVTAALKGTGILTGNGNGTGTAKKKCKKKGKKRSASAAKKKKCKKKKK
jgi:hypothetical protein